MIHYKSCSNINSTNLVRIETFLRLQQEYINERTNKVSIQKLKDFDVHRLRASKKEKESLCLLLFPISGDKVNNASLFKFLVDVNIHFPPFHMLRQQRGNVPCGEIKRI